MIKPPFSFTAWLAGRQAVSFALGIGVIFLITNYQSIIFLTNPENKDLFNYPFWLRVFLSHLDSLFFGLATAIFIFQSKSEWRKILYCIFEAIMICLNLNRSYLGNDNLFYLSCYIAVFSGFTLYFLGTLAKEHNLHQTEPTPYPPNQAVPNPPITNLFGQPYQNMTAQDTQTIGFEVGKLKIHAGRKPISTETIQAIQESLKNGMGVRQTARKYGVSEATVSKYKTA